MVLNNGVPFWNCVRPAFWQAQYYHLLSSQQHSSACSLKQSCHLSITYGMKMCIQNCFERLEHKFEAYAIVLFLIRSSADVVVNISLQIH
jgi:hypothetical protein